MGFTINPNWQNEDLKCHFCGKTKSVKYKTKIIIVDTIPNNEDPEKEVCICNRCALHMIGIEKNKFKR